MRNKKRPKYIEKQLSEINDILRSIRLKFDDKYNNDLFNSAKEYDMYMSNTAIQRQVEDLKNCVNKILNEF